MAKKNSNSYLDKIENEIQTNQSKVSMILGVLIVIVIGILIFNFFNKPKSDLGPAQQTQAGENQYKVQDGDTLFTIAEKFYQDGYKYEEIAKANNITNPDLLEPGQELTIPKVETVAQASPEPSPSAEALGTGGGNTTIWGEKIEGDKYTVMEGDWLSTIAGRAYGDILAFEKIAKANNVPNPDLIEPGQILTIPR